MRTRPDTPGTAVVDALAAYRLVRLAQRDQLPPLPRWRTALLARLGDHPAAELLDCPWCLSVHVAAVVAVARRVAPRWWGPLAGVLATSAAVGLLDRVEDTAAELAAPSSDVVYDDDARTVLRDSVMGG